MIKALLIALIIVVAYVVGVVGEASSAPYPDQCAAWSQGFIPLLGEGFTEADYTWMMYARGCDYNQDAGMWMRADYEDNRCPMMAYVYTLLGYSVNEMRTILGYFDCVQFWQDDGSWGVQSRGSATPIP